MRCVAGLDPSSIKPVHDGRSLDAVFAAEPARRSERIGFRAGTGRAWLDSDWKLVSN